MGCATRDKRLRRDSFTSVDQLIDAIELWVEHWNDDPKPFVWHRTAQEIIAKVQRGRRTSLVEPLLLAIRSSTRPEAAATVTAT